MWRNFLQVSCLIGFRWFSPHLLVPLCWTKETDFWTFETSREKGLVEDWEVEEGAIRTILPLAFPAVALFSMALVANGEPVSTFSAFSKQCFIWVWSPNLRKVQAVGLGCTYFSHYFFSPVIDICLLVVNIEVS